MQTRRMSLVEAVVNVTVGYVVAVGTQFAIFPAFGLRVGVIENLGIGAVFVCVSLIRSYALRRVFNRWGRA